MIAGVFVEEGLGIDAGSVPSPIKYSVKSLQLQRTMPEASPVQVSELLASRSASVLNSSVAASTSCNMTCVLEERPTRMSGSLTDVDDVSVNDIIASLGVGDEEMCAILRMGIDRMRANREQIPITNPEAAHRFDEKQRLVVAELRKAKHAVGSFNPHPGDSFLKIKDETGVVGCHSWARSQNAAHHTHIPGVKDQMDQFSVFSQNSLLYLPERDEVRQSHFTVANTAFGAILGAPYQWADMASIHQFETDENDSKGFYIGPSDAILSKTIGNFTQCVLGVDGSGATCSTLALFGHLGKAELDAYKERNKGWVSIPLTEATLRLFRLTERQTFFNRNGKFVSEKLSFKRNE
jgi:hypothetical protein